MKEVVLTKPPYMNPSEIRIADMHSVLNILNILIGELSLLKPREPHLREQLKELDRELNTIARQIREGADVAEMTSRIRTSESAVIALAKEVLSGESVGLRIKELEESIANLESVFSVFQQRLDELDMRSDDPDLWILVEPELFRKQFEEVFTAIAKNSKGEYAIHFDPARKKKGDYYFDLKLDTKLHGGKLWIPLRLIDVLRDLTANARKYTAPGGKISLNIAQDENGIRVIIEDTGCGIPGDEIEKIAEFGYRASNVRQRPTQGGGFGLTKAVWLVTNWGGSFTIRSEVDSGTAISLSLPNQDLPANPKRWSQ